MATGSPFISMFAKLIFLLMVSVCPCSGARRLSALVEHQTLLSYHKGSLLVGNVPVSILWYGKFTPAQRSIVTDLLLSLSPTLDQQLQLKNRQQETMPSVSQWWKISDKYFQKSGENMKSRILLGEQVSDEECSLGKSLKRAQIAKLAAKGNAKIPNGITLVLTAEDVAVEGFCMSNCGFHGSNVAAAPHHSQLAYIWVGNSKSQCPGQCAWPFHQPIYGPQNPPLVAPNGDVGLDGMVIQIASLLAGTVTNPFGKGFYQGPASAPLEASSACPGIYGKGAYPGYPGELLVDSITGASFNAHGTTGRKYLLPAMFDPSASSCSTVI